MLEITQERMASVNIIWNYTEEEGEEKEEVGKREVEHLR